MTTRLDKPVRRLVNIGGHDFIVELARGGISFRRPRHRVPVVAPLSGVLAYAGRMTGWTRWLERRIRP